MADGHVTACRVAAGNRSHMLTQPDPTVAWCNSRCGLTLQQSLSDDSVQSQRQSRSPSAVPRSSSQLSSFSFSSSYLLTQGLLQNSPFGRRDFFLPFWLPGLAHIRVKGAPVGRAGRHR